MYHPSQEKLVVLNCGCITTPFGSIKMIGEKFYTQACDNHPEEWHKILREASIHEQYAYFVCGKPAPKRATPRTFGWLFALPESNPVTPTSGNGNGFQTLF